MGHANLLVHRTPWPAQVAGGAAVVAVTIVVVGVAETVVGVGVAEDAETVVGAGVPEDTAVSGVVVSVSVAT